MPPQAPQPGVDQDAEPGDDLAAALDRLRRAVIDQENDSQRGIYLRDVLLLGEPAIRASFRAVTDNQQCGPSRALVEQADLAQEIAMKLLDNIATCKGRDGQSVVWFRSLVQTTAQDLVKTPARREYKWNKIVELGRRWLGDRDNA